MTCLGPALVDKSICTRSRYVDCIEWFVIVSAIFWLVVLQLIFLVIFFEHVLAIAITHLHVINSKSRRVPWSQPKFISCSPAEFGVGILNIKVRLRLINRLSHFILKIICILDSLGQVVSTRLIQKESTLFVYAWLGWGRILPNASQVLVRLWQSRWWLSIHITAALVLARRVSMEAHRRLTRTHSSYPWPRSIRRNSERARAGYAFMQLILLTLILLQELRIHFNVFGGDVSVGSCSKRIHYWLRFRGQRHRWVVEVLLRSAYSATFARSASLRPWHEIQVIVYRFIRLIYCFNFNLLRWWLLRTLSSNLRLLWLTRIWCLLLHTWILYSKSIIEILWCDKEITKNV